MRYLLDTSTLIDLMAEEAAVAARLRAVRGPDVAHLSIISWGELQRGLHALDSGSRKAQHVKELNVLLDNVSPGPSILLVDLDVADAWGRITHLLRRAGKPIPSNDAWIAATALAHGLTLVSSDAHFARVPGLELESWRA